MFDAVAKVGTLDVQLVYFRGSYPPVAGPFEAAAWPTDASSKKICKTVRSNAAKRRCMSI